MKYAVELAARGSRETLRAGAVIVSDDDLPICSAYTGEDGGATWRHVLQHKMRTVDTTGGRTMYLTVSTLSDLRAFDLAELLAAFEVDDIYVGLPDPALTHYRNDDPVMNREHMARFPDDLQREILAQNQLHYSRSEQNIDCNPHYHTHRIGESVLMALTAEGYAVAERDIAKHRRRSALVSLIRERYEVPDVEANLAVDRALSQAFEKKYGTYDYAYDARSTTGDWLHAFKSVHESISPKSLRESKIVNVGVGAGKEAESLFTNCQSVTYVDIAERGLTNIAKRMPHARTLVASADKLDGLLSNSYDLYVSLRTYNSSFFDTFEAASEARRVLKPGGSIILSIANGFLYSGQKDIVVPGLLVPGTDFVDLYRGMDTARAITNDLRQVGFRDVQITPANTEIFLSAIAG